MEQGHARTADVQGAGQGGDGGHLGHALLVGGEWDDGHVGVEQRPSQLLQVGAGQVGEHAALAQQAALVAEHGTEQHVAADETFHDDVGLAGKHHLHGALGAALGGGLVDEDGGDDAVAGGAADGLEGGLVFGADHGNAGNSHGLMVFRVCMRFEGKIR